MDPVPGRHTLAQQQGLLDPAIGGPSRLLWQHLHSLLKGYGRRPLLDPADGDAMDRMNARDHAHDRAHRDAAATDGAADAAQPQHG